MESGKGQGEKTTPLSFPRCRIHSGDTLYNIIHYVIVNFLLGALSDVLKDPLVHQLWAHSRKKRRLNTEQKLAISRALQSSFYLIQGPPGRYKCTCVLCVRISIRIGDSC